MPSLWLHFAELATEQLVWAVRGYAELIRLSPRAQIASRLHGYTFPWGGGGGATVPIRQEELAELMGLSRKTVNLVLRDFERQKLVERGYGSIKVLDPAGLHRIAMESVQ
jgi:CRP-like cAMP-binding protein